MSGVVKESMRMPARSNASRVTESLLSPSRSMRSDTKSVVAGVPGLAGSKKLATIGKLRS